MADEENSPIAAAVADQVDNAIADANAEAEHASEVAAAIAAGAMETERGQHVADVERRLEECQENVNQLSEAVASIVLGMTEQSAQLTLLIQQSSPTPILQSEEVAGPLESPAPPEETVIVQAEPEAEPPAPPAPEPPRKKRHRWI